jgi:hypothetical protein
MLNEDNDDLLRRFRKFLFSAREAQREKKQMLLLAKTEKERTKIAKELEAINQEISSIKSFIMMRKVGGKIK